MDKRPHYEYKFIENQDFVCLTVLLSEGRGGKNRVDYHLSLNMAKELAMVERTEKGKQARQYFIECEKRLMESQRALPTFANPAELAREYARMATAFAIEYERAETEHREKVEAHRQIEAMLPAKVFHDQVVSSEELWDMPFVFSVLQKKTGQEFTRKSWLSFLRRHGIACQPNPFAGITEDKFVPRKDYIGMWFVGEPTITGTMVWKVRPLAIAQLVTLIEQERYRITA